MMQVRDTHTEPVTSTSGFARPSSVQKFTQQQRMRIGKQPNASTLDASLCFFHSQTLGNEPLIAQALARAHSCGSDGAYFLLTTDNNIRVVARSVAL